MQKWEMTQNFGLKRAGFWSYRVMRWRSLCSFILFSSSQLHSCALPTYISWAPTIFLSTVEAKISFSFVPISECEMTSFLGKANFSTCALWACTLLLLQDLCILIVSYFCRLFLFVWSFVLFCFVSRRAGSLSSVCLCLIRFLS